MATTWRNFLATGLSGWKENIVAFAGGLGAPGLFLISFLDSSVLTFPVINDLLLVELCFSDDAGASDALFRDWIPGHTLRPPSTAVPEAAYLASVPRGHPCGAPELCPFASDTQAPASSRELRVCVSR